MSGLPSPPQWPAHAAPDRPLRICVATLTRRRPNMLAALVGSLQRLVPPPASQIDFLIVENDDTPRSRDLVAAWSAQPMPGPLHYVLETGIGIPVARNRAVAHMVEQGHDLLLFVDDDITVPPDWVALMVAEHRLTGAALIGGPVAARLPEGLAGYRGLLAQGIVERYRQKARRAAARRDAGQARRITIVTSNWLGHRSLFVTHALRFDDTMRFSGGSDAKFDANAVACGVVKSWASAALVTEQVPLARVSFRYQWRRARDQSMTTFRRKLAVRPAAALAVLPFAVLAKAAGAVGLLAIAPVAPGRALVALARTLGWITGRILGAFGRRSRLYETTTGS